MNRALCALLALWGLCCVAFAKQATLGAASLTLPPPAGYCEMDEAQPSDARMIGAVSAALERGPTRLLAISADCRQLEDWRAGRRPLLGNYAAVSHPQSLGEYRPASSTCGSGQADVRGNACSR